MFEYEIDENFLWFSKSTVKESPKSKEQKENEREKQKDYDKSKNNDLKSKRISPNNVDSPQDEYDKGLFLLCLCKIFMQKSTWCMNKLCIY